MPIGTAELLAFQIPEGHQTVTFEDAASHTWSLGLGHNPLNQRQLDFIAPTNGASKILPTYALILAHPGFWLGHPESGIDPKAALHASQSLKILVPLPIAGAVTSRSHISALVDKGPGETIRAEMWNNGAFRASVIERKAMAIDNDLAVLSSNSSVQSQIFPEASECMT